MQRARSWIEIALALSLAVPLGACASRGVMDPAAVQRMSRVESTLRVAQEHGAEREPRARRHLALARQQVVDAQQLAREGNQTGAKQKLDRAAADAELALALSRETNVRRDADALQARIDALQAPPAQTDTQEVTP